jgi:hypothetical protein
MIADPVTDRAHRDHGSADHEAVDVVHPQQLGRCRVQVGRHPRQRDVEDADVDRDEQRRQRQQRERDPRVAGPRRCRGESHERSFLCLLVERRSWNADLDTAAEICWPCGFAPEDVQALDATPLRVEGLHS